MFKLAIPDRENISQTFYSKEISIPASHFVSKKESRNEGNLDI